MGGISPLSLCHTFSPPPSRFPPPPSTADNSTTAAALPGLQQRIAGGNNCGRRGGAAVFCEHHPPAYTLTTTRYTPPPPGRHVCAQHARACAVPPAPAGSTARRVARTRTQHRHHALPTTPLRRASTPATPRCRAAAGAHAAAAGCWDAHVTPPPPQLRVCRNESWWAQATTAAAATNASLPTLPSTLPATSGRAASCASKGTGPRACEGDGLTRRAACGGCAVGVLGMPS